MMGQKLDHEELSGQKRGGRLRGLPALTPRRAGLRTRPASALQLQPRRGTAQALPSHGSQSRLAQGLPLQQC